MFLNFNEWIQIIKTNKIKRQVNRLYNIECFNFLVFYCLKIYYLLLIAFVFKLVIYLFLLVIKIKQTNKKQKQWFFCLQFNIKVFLLFLFFFVFFCFYKNHFLFNRHMWTTKTFILYVFRVGCEWASLNVSTTHHCFK